MQPQLQKYKKIVLDLKCLKRFFYGNFLVTLKRYKSYIKNNIKWLKIENGANIRKKVRECQT